MTKWSHNNKRKRMRPEAKFWRHLYEETKKNATAKIDELERDIQRLADAVCWGIDFDCKGEQWGQVVGENYPYLAELVEKYRKKNSLL